MECSRIAFLTAIKKVDFLPLIHVICIAQQSSNLLTPAYSVAKRRQRRWQTISLLIKATNDNKYIVNKATLCEVIFSFCQVANTNNTNTFWLGCNDEASDNQVILARIHR